MLNIFLIFVKRKSEVPFKIAVSMLVTKCKVNKEIKFQVTNPY